MYDFLWLQIDDLPPQDCTRLLHFDTSGNGPLGDGVAFLILGAAGTFYSDRGAGLEGAPPNPTIGFDPGVAADRCSAAAQATGLIPTVTLVMLWTP